MGFIGDLENLELKPNPAEVESLFTVSLYELLDESKWSTHDFSTPVFNGGGEGGEGESRTPPIWGLTAYILKRFLKDVLVKCSDSTR